MFFKKNKRKIYFEKLEYINHAPVVSRYEVISDNEILRVLNELKEEYNFEIIKVNLRHTNLCSISISCNDRKKYNEIFIKLTSKLGNKIHRISF